MGVVQAQLAMDCKFLISSMTRLCFPKVWLSWRLIWFQTSSAAVFPQPPSCRTRRVRRWTSTSPGSALPRTGSSLPRTMPQSRSTLGTWMRMGCMMAIHHICSLWICLCSG